MNMNLRKLIISLSSVVFGLLIGCLILILSGSNPLVLFESIYLSTFGQVSKFEYWLLYATLPLILTGLSVAFAYRCGIFNIGAEGQFQISSIITLAVAVSIVDLPFKGGAFIALIVGVIVGSLWALIPALLKAYFNIHEVVITIMLNWIAFYLSNYFIKTYLKGEYETTSLKISDSNLLTLNLESTDGFLSILLNMIIPIIIVLISVFVFWFIVNKTKFGYEIKAVGYSKSAAKYAGINEKKRIIQTMLISGAFAGLSGAIFTLSIAKLSVLASFVGYGFNGIAVAMLGQLNAVGVLFSSLLLGALSTSAAALENNNVNREISDIIIGLIILFSALGPIIYSKFSNKKGTKNE